MKLAAQTWALVVGIDQYADPKIPQLEGAVADAVAFADWLRALGVPDDQVFFHASPTRMSRGLLKGRKPNKATAQAIDSSVVALEKAKGGKRLVAYLAGHGIFEADAGRLFLVEEFTQDSPMNMGLEKYVRRFLSMPFERQFLFMDGCQNLPYSDTQRQKITGQMFGGAVGKPIRAHNRLVACFAASITQRAYEVDGRGVFTRRLLEAIDLDDPWAKAVSLDFDTGESFLDLRKAVFGYVRPCVEQDVRGTTHQTPDVQAFPGDTEEATPLYSFRDDSPPGMVTVQITPDAATPEIESVIISGAGNQRWSFDQPRPPKHELDVPFSVRIPLGRDIIANCLLRKESAWAGALEKRLQVSPETSVVFELTSPVSSQAPQTVELQTVDAEGRPALYQFSYDDVRDRLGLGEAGAGLEGIAGVHYTEREVGPIFAQESNASEDAFIDSRRLAAEWADAIQELTPSDVGVSTILTGTPAEGLRPKLRLCLPRGGAARLAGPIANEPLVWIGLSENAPSKPLSASPAKPGLRSLASLEVAPEVEVQPGHQLVRIDLPWGSWSAAPSALPGGVTDIELPTSIGDPPLRVLLNAELGRKGSLLFGLGTRAPRPVIRNGLGRREALPFRQVRAGSARWTFSAPSPAWIRRPGAVAIATAGSWSFPFLYGRSLAFARVGRNVRVEPLSQVSSPAWDLLLARGLLDGLPAEEAIQLTYGKWEDALLGLAGAYAVHALPISRNKNRFLSTVVANLRRLSARPDGLRVSDIDLLSAAHSARTRKKVTAADRKTLENWATVGAVPVLQWGVSLAIGLIEDDLLAGPVFDRWHDQLEEIEETISPISVWTAWRHSTRTRSKSSTARKQPSR